MKAKRTAVCVRMTPEQLAAIRAAAGIKGISLNAFIMEFSIEGARNVMRHFDWEGFNRMLAKDT